MTAYYKATRPDGTDFWSGTIGYAAALASGEVIRHPAPRMVRDDASTYLSVSISTADCTAFSWPCRLFRVEPVGEVMDGLAASPNKRAVSALRVAEELPAWQAFGPNGEEVVRVIEEASRLTTDQAEALRAAWGAARSAARSAAVAAWGAARSAARDAAGVAAGVAARSAAWDAAGGAAGVSAGVAARDAAIACIVRDRLSDEHFQILAGPWISVMGDPSEAPR